MKFFTSVHLLLLGYIIAALVFWEISLQKQNGQIYAQQLLTLQSTVDSVNDAEIYYLQKDELKHRLSARTTQYVAEGATFLIVILIGAGVVYTAISNRIKLSRQQNNFMLSVTHELKSPIAAMKLNLQTLERHKLDEQKQAQLLARCVKEADRLNDLCNNMLFASQIEGRQYKPSPEAFNLSELVEDAISNYAARYPRRFEEDIQENCILHGDKVMLQMAVNNLLENAVKYTPDDKTIAVSLAVKQGNLILQVRDEGSGIPDSEKKNIFNKFYRIGNEETRRSKGTGLGLYLTNSIVLQHKGKITVKDNVPTGAIFELCLPK